MRNISQLAASLMLLATQANVSTFVGTAAAEPSVQPAPSVLEVRINTNTGEPVQFKAPNKANFDTDILVPLRAAQAQAQAARDAAKQQAAAARKSRATVRVASAPVALPAGSHVDWMSAAGIAAGDFGYVDTIIDRESGWGVTKSNYGGSGAYGLGQAMPASKMAPFGADYMTNPVTQLQWANSYAVSRYGSWANAYSYWTTHHNW